MQRLTQRLWSHCANWHVGDLAWQRFQHVGRESEWQFELWERDGEVAAWAWEQRGEDLYLQVDPACADLADEVLKRFPGREVMILDAEHHLVAALERHGYVRQDGEYQVFMTHDLRDLPEVEVPEGFTVRPITEADLARRVEVHREVWHPSRVTEESYRNVMAAWPYRADLDWVVEAPDGRFAASCLIWFDDENRVGELEPVGTHPDFRRMGLGAAVCHGAMRALRDLSAEQAIVYPFHGKAAEEFYERLGFRPYARTLNYSR
ncbi:GNAT family N-acetyltransferase [Lentzea sp.]|uniref:GNAT family N-acetyltransferase n=1 Tax=Lentzea sp. TaxID=56099 RepID=UPI002C031619|nr:GNAT family N-acetyltransferase [Lentzea sp.]HUQ60508.1 GNAT family N-acetyltransferase [Lentzea sp.]